MPALEIYRGKKKSFKVLVWNPDKTPCDLTGSTIKSIRWVATRHPGDGFDDSNAEIVKTIGAGIVVTAVGEARVDFVPADTRNLASGKLDYQVQVATDASDPVITEEGTLRIKPVIVTTVP